MSTLKVKVSEVKELKLPLYYKSPTGSLHCIYLDESGAKCTVVSQLVLADEGVVVADKIMSRSEYISSLIELHTGQPLTIKDFERDVDSVADPMLNNRKFQYYDKVLLKQFKSERSIKWSDGLHLDYVGTIAKIIYIYKNGLYRVLLHDGKRELWSKSGLVHFQRDKPEVGDLVKTLNPPGTIKESLPKKYYNKTGVVEKIGDRFSVVHGCGWPNSSIRIVKPVSQY